MGEQLPSAESYRKQGIWLLVLADFALTLAKQQEGPNNPGVEGTAAQHIPLQKKGVAGAPAHWLALLGQESPLEWIESQDFGQPVSDPNAPLDGPGSDSCLPGEGPESREAVAQFQPISKRKKHPQPEPDSMEMKANAQPAHPRPAATAMEEKYSAAKTPPPAERLPVRPVTRLRLRPTPGSAPVHTPDAQAPNKKEMDDARETAWVDKSSTAQGRSTAEPLTRQANVPGQFFQSPEASSADIPSEKSAPLPTRLHLKPTRHQEAVPQSQPQPEKQKIHLRSPEKIGNAGNSPATDEPVLAKAAPLQPSTAKPAERGHSAAKTTVPATTPLTPNPVHRPATVRGHWPKQPRPLSPASEVANDAYDAYHQQRLDDEQKGRPWNA